MKMNMNPSDKKLHWYDKIDTDIVFAIVIAGLVITFGLFITWGTMPDCPRCGYDNHPSNAYCSKCGQQMRITEDNIEQ